MRRYFYLSWRVAVKNKVLSGLNIVSLGLATLSIFVLGCYISHVYSIDKHIPMSENVFRINTEIVDGAQAQKIALSKGELKSKVLQTIPEITAVTHFINSQYNVIIKSENEEIEVETGYYVDEDFFKVFDLELLRGDKNQALKNPQSIVISSTLANKYFGSTDIIGQQLDFYLFGRKFPLLISGIVKQEERSHLNFDYLLTGKTLDFMWNENSPHPMFFTYFLSSGDIDDQTLQEKVDLVSKENLTSSNSSSNSALRKYNNKVMRLSELKYQNDLKFELYPGYNRIYIRLVLLTTILIVVLAVINQLNLCLSNFVLRSKEYGMFKLFGASKRSFLLRYGLELSIYSFFGFIIGLALLTLFDLKFDMLLGVPLLESLRLNPILYFLVFFCLLIVSAILSYIILIKLELADKFKDEFKFKRGKFSISDISLTWQIFVAIILSIVSFVLSSQINLMQTRNPGYTVDQIVMIEKPEDISGNSWTLLKVKLEELSYVKSIGYSLYPIIGDYNTRSFWSANSTKENQMKVSWQAIDSEYMSTFQHQFLSGRNFSKEIKSDSIGIILNKVAFNLFGGENSLELKSNAFPDTKFRLIGVVDNFSFSNLKSINPPVVFTYNTVENLSKMYVSLNGEMVEDLKFSLSEMSSELGLDTPFEIIEIRESYDNLLTQEKSLAVLTSLLGIISIILCLIGVIGSTLQRMIDSKKAITIKKVLGAPYQNLLFGTMKNFLVYFIISCVISLPISYLICKSWLEDFVFRINLDLPLFILPLVLVIVVISLVIFFSSFRILNQNPTKSLRSSEL